MKARLPLVALHCYVGLSLLIFFGLEAFKTFVIISPNWLTHYLNDFLCIPIVATICLHAVWRVKRNYMLRLKIGSILSLVVLFSVYFELYLPENTSRYTGDLIDVLCYIAGGGVFYGFQKLQ